MWNVFHDSRGNLWICTDKGLDKLDKITGKFTHYTDGFPGSVTYIAVEDKNGKLWVATEGGLIKFNPVTEQVERVYTSDDGLHSHSFFGQGMIITKDGEIFLGGLNGLNTFYPNELKDNENKPSIYLTLLEQGGNPIKTGSSLEKTREIILDANNNFFEFEYAASNYTNSSKNRYKYILIGRDKEWFDAGTNRIARYTGLEPGMYILKVQGSNNDGVWSDKEAKLNIYVKPNINKSALFYTLDELKNNSKLSLSYDNQSFTFEIAPKDFSIVEDQRYSHVLEGYDRNWINSGNKRYVNYSQVSPGNYRLKVKDGSKIVVDIPVIINPPFYQTWWFRTLVLVIFIILVTFIYYLRTRALRRKHAELEKTVKERTYELELAKDKAESATKAKSEFLANMSHEIRTPMNAILDFSEILQRKENDPKLRKYINTIYSSGNSLLKLINDILDLSKVEAGKLEIQYTSVNIDNIFKETSSVFQFKLKDQGVDLILDIQKDIPQGLLLDGIRLRQILTNLIGNSVKFTENGYIKLSVTYEYTTNAKSLVNLKIAVEDTGIGIPEEDQKTIFEAFTQVKGQNQEKFGGTGLGLAITKRLVEAMNGNIHFDSKINKGTTFFIELKDIEVTSKIETEEIDMFDVSRIEFKKAKVLITDDIEYNRELIKGYFEGYDFEILEADNGKVALDQIRHHHPDLILLDLKMPVMSGYEVANILKKDSDIKDIPIIVLTASSMKHDEPRIHKFADAYLRKPTTKSRLIQEMIKFLPYKTIEEKTKSSLEEEKITDQEIIKRINSDIIPIIDKLETRLSIRNLEILTRNCRKIGEELNCKLLLEHANKLASYLEDFNLDALDMMVKKIKKMI